jgi:hypothetical protein
LVGSTDTRTDLSSGTSSLRLKDLARSDTGNYSCLAENLVGSAGSNALRLAVKCEGRHPCCRKHVPISSPTRPLLRSSNVRSRTRNEEKVGHNFPADDDIPLFRGGGKKSTPDIDQPGAKRSLFHLLLRDRRLSSLFVCVCHRYLPPPPPPPTGIPALVPMSRGTS